MAIEHAMIPWLHIGFALAVLLILAACAAQSNDRESAYSLAVIGALVLLCVAVEHGILAYFRARWP